MGEKLNHNWQNDIYNALEKAGSFNMTILKIRLESDDTGIEFMQQIAFDKRIYEYLNSLGLVNRGWCPITGEKIDESLNYSIFGRAIFISEKAFELGKEKKEEFKKEHPNFESNLKEVKSFLENTLVQLDKPRFDSITFVISLIISGYLSYTIIKPATLLGYVGTFGLFGIFFL